MKQRSMAGKTPKPVMDHHRDIILEALRDYRRWWADEEGNDRCERIDRAIAFLQEG
jgi:hypothetical protein